MVLAEAEDVEAELVGKSDLLNEIAQPLRTRDPLPADRVHACVAEGE